MSSKPALPSVEGPIDAKLEVLPPESQRDSLQRPREAALAWVIQHLMDNLFHLPGTKARFGLTPLLELIPGIGDGASVVVSAITIVEGARRRVPKVILVRMGLNIVLNGLIGILPIVGEAFSFWFKPSYRNYQLLQKHAALSGTTAAQKASTRDWTFVVGLIALLFILMGAFIAVGAYVVYKFFHLAWG